MAIVGVAYPHSQAYLTDNRHWQIIRDKANQVAGALWQEKDSYHSTHVIQGERESYFYCLYGDAFSKVDNVPLCEADLYEIALKGPERLTAHFWGKYLFICFDKAAKQFICCSDPSSQWTVYWSWSAQHGLWFSDTITCLHQALSERGERPGWNTAFFSTWLRTGTVQNGTLPFDSISEVPAGCVVAYSPGQKPKMTPVWDPLAHPTQSASHNPFDILKNYLSLHLPPNDQPVLELSGGLESSSILLALRAISSGPLNCAHYYNSHVASSNELEHARNVAQYAHARLYEIDTQVLSFAPLQDIPRVAKPHLRYCLLGFQQSIANRLDEAENTLLINGHGGDSLFLAPPPYSALADALLTLRWRQLKRIAMGLALMRRAPLFQVAQRAVQSLFSSDPFHHIAGNFTLFSKAARQQPIDGRSHLHPFIQKTKHHLPGKWYQLFLAFLSLDDVRSPAYPFKTFTHYPFLCQPMVEMALSTPSYAHFEDAHNRILLRKAVSEATGYPHLWRRNKGETTGINLLGIRQHKDYVMELCLEGFLAKSGYIDVAQTHTAIRESSKGHNGYFMDILNIFAVELFIQGWQRV